MGVSLVLCGGCRSRTSLSTGWQPKGLSLSRCPGCNVAAIGIASGNPTPSRPLVRLLRAVAQGHGALLACDRTDVELVCVGLCAAKVPGGCGAAAPLGHQRTCRMHA